MAAMPAAACGVSRYDACVSTTDLRAFAMSSASARASRTPGSYHGTATIPGMPLLRSDGRHCRLSCQYCRDSNNGDHSDCGSKAQVTIRAILAEALRERGGSGKAAAQTFRDIAFSWVLAQAADSSPTAYNCSFELGRSARANLHCFHRPEGLRNRTYARNPFVDGGAAGNAAWIAGTRVP
jgi:hypothetical protein